MSLSFYKITGDDFGYCPKRNQGILELVDKGILNSVSVLVNGKFLDKAVIETTARVGLHLNLTEGLPVTQQDKVKSLLKKDGLFSGKSGFREKLHSNCINLCEVHEIIFISFDLLLTTIYKVKSQVCYFHICQGSVRKRQNLNDREMLFDEQLYSLQTKFKKKQFCLRNFV